MYSPATFNACAPDGRGAADRPPFLELDPGFEPELSSPLGRAHVDEMVCAYDIRRFFSFRTAKCPQHFILEKQPHEHFHSLLLKHEVTIYILFDHLTQ